jgi:acetylornithine deacetylase/succinyl-diaminopimelate desuccinylase-like protein
VTAPPPATIAAVLRQVDTSIDASRERLFDLLRIPSISTQPDHRRDCVNAAEWLRDQLAELGFRADVRPTGGHPVVVAHHPAPRGYQGPHVLFYGHYDVQPAEPFELWTHPPFDPQLVDGPHGKRFVARGVADNKGQFMMFLEALRAWNDAAGGIPAHITVLLEGEEEILSPSLEPFITENKDELCADIALISDTTMWDIDTPAVITRLRGAASVQMVLKAPDRDLHSGIYGGSALNPINALTRILGELHDTEGRIQLPGFYDKVKPVSSVQRQQWNALDFDEPAFLAKVGLAVPTGEHGYSALERLWTRPTADINGIWGGYAGAGMKSIIASEAGAKVTFRLVPNQDPVEVMEQFKRFVSGRLTPGASVELELLGATPGIEVNLDSPWFRAAQAALAEEYGKPAVLMGAGYSLPVVTTLRNVLGIDSLLMGFILDDDQVHSPNERLEQRCFHHGIRSHARLLAKFAGG